MSGSSLDGLDMALCRFTGDPACPAWEILDTYHVAYTASWQERLRQAPDLSGKALVALDAGFGRYIGEEVTILLRRAQASVDLIASHGHTVFHDPGAGFTLQIGQGAEIAAGTAVDTVTSFRGSDIALGGQGAPFAPAADIALFPQYDGYLNLGGIANGHIRRADGTRRAWDICPCNQPLNTIAARLQLPYDPDGRLAREGVVHAGLVGDLIGDFPAAAGQPRGMSNQEVRDTWLARMAAHLSSPHDQLATVTEAIARLITGHLQSAGLHPGTIMVTGGGVHNAFLMERLHRLGETAGYQFLIPPELVVNYKECLLMAYLGYRIQHRLPFDLACLTGARRESIGGAYYFGRNGA